MAHKYRDAKWNEETQSGTYSDKIHWGEMKVKSTTMIHQLTPSCIAVKVPEDAGRYTMRATNHCDNGSISFYDKFTNEESMCLIPPGNWKILGRGNDLTEEQWRGIVPEMIIGERWSNYNGDYPIWFHSAKESGKSLLKSKNLNPDVLILVNK